MLKVTYWKMHTIDARFKFGLRELRDVEWKKDFLVMSWWFLMHAQENCTEKRGLLLSLPYELKRSGSRLVV